MRSLLFALIFCVLACSATVSNAQSSPATPATDASWEIQMSVVMNMSQLGRYLSTDPILSWRMDWFSAGIGTRLIAGTSQFDLHTTPFIRLTFGPAFIHGGWNIEIVDETSQFQVVDHGPYGAVGLEWFFFSMGTGTLGVATGIDLFLPLWRDPEQPPLEQARLLPWPLEDPFLSELARLVAGYTMARLSVVYTFSL